MTQYRSDEEENTQLFSVVRLLTVLGQDQYELARWSSSSKRRREDVWRILISVFLALPAVIEAVPLSLGQHTSSVLFSEFGKLIAAVLAGAGVTNFAEALRLESRKKHLTFPPTSPQREAQIVSGAILLKQLVPDSVAAEIAKRVRNCWNRYTKLLEGDHLPDEIEAGTEQLKTCICREVLRLQDINGGELPESAGILGDYLERYHCRERD